MAGESIRFNASLNTVGFSSGAKNLQNIAQGAAAGISRHFGKIAMAVVGIGAAFLGVRAAVQSFNAAIAMGGQLNDLSARTGETAGNLAILQRAFENAGAGADAVGQTINRLQRAIVEAGEGGKEQAEAFGKLGLNLERLKELTPTEQLQAVAAALQKVGNDSDRSAIAMQLLGRSGGELLPLLRAMGVELDIARKQLGSTPQVMDRVTASFDTIGDNFAAIGEKGKEFAAGLLEQIAPALVDVTTRLANIDAAGFGAKLSEYAASTLAWFTETFKLSTALSQIETAIKAITEGEFGEGLSLMFATAKDTALNAINTIVAAASAAIETVSASVGKMFSSDGALLHLLKSSFTIAANYFREVLYGALADFMDAIGRSGMADTFRYEAETAARSIEMLTYGIGAQVALVGDQAKEVFAGIPQEFKAAYEENMQNPLFAMEQGVKNTADQAARLKAELSGAGQAAATVNPRVAGTAAAAAAETPAERIARQEAEARAKAGTRGGGGGGSNKPFDPVTGFGAALRERGSQAVNFDPATSRLSSTGLAIERTKERFSVDKTAANIRADLARMENRNRSAAERADRFEQAGQFGAAERLRGRIERRVAEEEKRLAEKYNLDVQDMAKTPEERARAEEEARAKHAGGGGKSDLEVAVNKVLSLLTTHIPSIDEKLPQTALVYS
jgi:hypothetical protein